MKNDLCNSIGQLFRETGKLISEQKEVTGVSTTSFQRCHVDVDKAYCVRSLITNAKTYVFSDSVLCVGKMGDDPIATWKSKN